jgi:hypothetical protein
MQGEVRGFTHGASLNLKSLSEGCKNRRFCRRCDHDDLSTSVMVMVSVNEFKFGRESDDDLVVWSTVPSHHEH